MTWRATFGPRALSLTCDLIGVHYLRIIHGWSENSLRVVGHMTKELLKLKCLYNLYKIIWDENGQTKGFEVMLSIWIQHLLSNKYHFTHPRSLLIEMDKDMIKHNFNGPNCCLQIENSWGISVKYPTWNRLYFGPVIMEWQQSTYFLIFDLFFYRPKNYISVHC